MTRDATVSGESSALMRTCETWWARALLPRRRGIPAAADPPSRGRPAPAPSRSISTSSGASSQTTVQSSVRRRRAAAWVINPPPQAMTWGPGRRRAPSSAVNSRSRKNASPSVAMTVAGERPEVTAISLSRSTASHPRRSATSGATVLLPDPGSPTRAIRRTALIATGRRHGDVRPGLAVSHQRCRRQTSPSRPLRGPTRASPRPPRRRLGRRRYHCARSAR